MKVETGVIAAAGSGTRMLPVTLGYPKELLPIINKPAIQLIVEEFIEAGLKKIVIVTGENPDPLHRQYKHPSPPPRGKHKPLDEFVDRLSVVEILEGGGYEMEDVVEKPPREEAKSNLAMFGRFLLSTAVIQILSEIPLGKSNELWLTDAVRE